METTTGDLTDVAGVRVGHWTDPRGRTGCTLVLLPDDGGVASVDVRGASPGTRETDLLAVENRVQVAHAILLCGGSAFGLAAADGVMRRLAERGVGVPTPGIPVPIVPAAVLYDLHGEAPTWPDADSGYQACLAAERGDPCGSGPRGAGTGATVGKLLGVEHSRPGGLGTASLRLPGGGTVGAVVAVNAVGDVVDESGELLAGPGAVSRLLGGDAPAPPPPGAHTTLAVVVTDLALSKTEARRLAVVAHDGLARSIRPVHTASDGDTVFAASTGLRSADPSTALALQVGAVEVVATAVRTAVRRVG